MNYTKAHAKDHALANWRGVCNVILPSFSADLKRLNEKAIRHDVRRNIEHGFWGALLVSECATTAAEYRRFMEIAVDEAKGRHRFLMHGTFDTAEDIIAMARDAEAIGMEGLLLGHPNSFYPKSEEQLYDYLAHVCNHTNLAVVLFAASHWNFSRLHPSGYPPRALARAAALPNVVAIKYEVGRPGIAGDYEMWKMLKGQRVLFSDPLEAHSPLTVELFGQQWMGTSNYEYWGGAVPEYFGLLNQGHFDRAMEIYWGINPARAARVAIQATFGGANFIHRYLWKYQAWLQGYNGGPMRQPVMKLTDAQMRAVRDPLTRSGFTVADEAPADFYLGRNPE
ncbi:MAG TPA: dihydrodipicolinate synthase family protein [Candidatus Binataceae bacterium]|nr:dihydrodipicolinate synthase family protein [Candidatus Binataceae bacterium]